MDKRITSQMWVVCMQDIHMQTKQKTKTETKNSIKTANASFFLSTTRQNTKKRKKKEGQQQQHEKL